MIATHGGASERHRRIVASVPRGSGGVLAQDRSTGGAGLRSGFQGLEGPPRHPQVRNRTEEGGTRPCEAIRGLRSLPHRRAPAANKGVTDTMGRKVDEAFAAP